MVCNGTILSLFNRYDAFKRWFRWELVSTSFAGGFLFLIWLILFLSEDIEYDLVQYARQTFQPTTNVNHLTNYEFDGLKSLCSFFRSLNVNKWQVPKEIVQSELLLESVEVVSSFFFFLIFIIIFIVFKIASSKTK